MKVSIVIATYNRENVLIKSIKSVLNQTYKDFELIIVDQTLQHKAATQNFLTGVIDSRFRYFQVKPPSIAASENFGISMSRGEIIIFIDDDVILNDNFIKEHVEAYREPNIGGVAGRIIEPGMPVSKVLYRITSIGWKNRGGSFNYLSKSETKDVRGCNMSFRKKVLVEVGGFDTAFVKNAYRFESDMSHRIVSSGYKILFCPTASLTHFHVSTGGSRSTSSLFEDLESYKNSARFFYKNLNHSILSRIGFYLVHLMCVVPSTDPKKMMRKLYFLFAGIRLAKIELKESIPVVISNEMKRVG